MTTGGIRLATEGFKAGHMTDRSLIGGGRDLGTPREGSVPLTERFGVLSPHAEAIHPLKDGILQSVSSPPQQNGFSSKRPLLLRQSFSITDAHVPVPLVIDLQIVGSSSPRRLS